MMGALPPSPRDLPLLFARMDAFCFTPKRLLPYNRFACQEGRAPQGCECADGHVV